MAKLTKAQIEARDTARSRLREMLPPGSDVYVTVQHVSRSGMQREIKCMVGHSGGGIQNITWLVAQATENRVGKNDGVIIGGCGMDMGFALVNELSYALHGTGNHDAAELRERSGYTLKHVWI